MPGLAFRTAILTVSDTAAAGDREDRSGEAAAEFVRAAGGHVVIHEIVPDERRRIADKLCHYADYLKVNLILTTGGTGLAPRDVTPEATRDVISREAPGLAEAMRRETAAATPFAILSRAVTGIRGSTLIVNLPGSPKGVVQCLEVLAPSLRHGLKVLSGEVRSHDKDPGGSA